MSLISLFFSFSGHVRRSTFWFASIAWGFVVIFVGVFAFRMAGFTINAEESGLISREAAMLQVFGGAGVTFVLLVVGGIWVQLALVFKRVRDMGGGMGLAWAYTCLLFLSIIPMLGLVFTLINFVVWLVIGCHNGVGLSEKDEVDPQVFGSAAKSSATQPQTSALSEKFKSDEDLIARAAQLRAEEEGPRSSAKPARRSAAPTGGGFGQRAKPAFGRR